MEQRPNQRKGQTLVEVAVVLPLLIFVITCCFKFFLLCHNAMVLQSLAADAARRLALSDGKHGVTMSQLLGGYRIAGKTTPPRLQHETQAIHPWRAFKGWAVVKQPGQLLNAQVSAAFLPEQLWSWGLSRVALSYSAEFPKEPPIPEEN